MRWLAGLALLALACATPPSDDEVEAELHRIAASVRPRGELRYVMLNAGSPMDAWAQVTESTAEGKESSSQPARRLARAFSQAEKRRIAVVTGGPYASLNERTVLDAFLHLRAKRLPYLTLVYASPKPPSDELRDAIARTGATLVVHNMALR
jgi:predicted aconitase